MRVTSYMLMNSAMRDLDTLRSQYAKAQDGVNGRVLKRPSEDPTRVVEAMDLSGAKLRLERSRRSGEDAREWMSVSESGLTTMIEVLQKARELAVSAGNPAAQDPVAQESIAQQVLVLRDTVVRQMNEKHRDQYVFAGWKTNTQPFQTDAAGSAVYSGDSGTITRDVAPGLAVGVNTPGDQLLAKGDFVKALTDMAADMRAGNTTNVTNAGIQRIDDGLNHLTVLRSDLGARQNQVEQYETFAMDQLLDIEERLTNISGADLETAVLKMTEAQTAYQVALASFAKALPPSLVDYMLK